jgi:hypothetical protein
MRPNTTRRKPLFRRTYQREKSVSVPKRSNSCIQPPAHLAEFSGVGGAEQGAQPTTWKRNKLVFLRNPSNNKGMVDARPVHQIKSTRCNTLISGRLSAKAEKARLPKPEEWYKSRCNNEVFCSRADTSAINPSREFAPEWKHRHLARHSLKGRSSVALSCYPAPRQYTRQRR